MHRLSAVALALVAIIGIGAVGGALAGVDLDDARAAVADAPLAAGSVEPAATDEPNRPTLHVTADARTDGAGANSSVTVTAIVQHAGETPVHETLALRIDEDGDGEFEATLATRPVTVPADAPMEVNFSVEGSRFGPGRHPYGVGNAEGTVYWATDAITLEPASFDLVGVTAPTVVRGEPASISATVANVGDFDGTEPVTLVLGGDRLGLHPAVVDRITKPVRVPADAEERVTFEVETGRLPSGTYPVRLETMGATHYGRVVVQTPATYHIDAVNATPEVVRGARLNLSVTVTNRGDVAGTQPVGITGLEPLDRNRTVALDPGESETVDFTVETQPLARGNYTYQVATAAQTADRPLRVRDAHFALANLRGSETSVLGDDLDFQATVVNAGDAAGTQSVELKLDLDGDDRPESYNLTTQVTLAPGERTTVGFTVPGDGPGESTSARDLVGSHVYGIFSEDTNVTAVFAVKRHGSGGGGSGSTATHDRATRDEISQAKYGHYYATLSEETRQQVDELYRRQPYAGGRAVTEVLTREEIARRHYGIDVEPGEPFDFAALDVAVQQRIEAEFDAQFESDAGDRVESWDELARAQYGRQYERLTPEQQAAVRDAYWAQFEDD